MFVWIVDPLGCVGDEPSEEGSRKVCQALVACGVHRSESSKRRCLGYVKDEKPPKSNKKR